MNTKREPGNADDAVKEFWKPVAGWEGIYEVSDLGRVRSLDRVVVNSRGVKRKFTGQILRQRTNQYGYEYVTLKRPGETRTFVVHRLVSTTFIGPRSCEMVVRHVNGDPSDNRLVNLAYGTYGENAADRDLHGTVPRGEDSTSAKLTEADAREIRTLAKAGYNGKQIAERISSVTYATITSICRGDSWAHLGPPIALNHRGRDDRRMPNQKLSEDDIYEIKMQLANGERQRDIAAAFNVSHSAISSISREATWRHIDGPPGWREKASHRGPSKLDEERVADIKRRLAAGESPKELANEYCVSSDAIRLIASGKSWAHVPGEVQARGTAHGSRHHYARLTEDKVHVIKQRLLSGDTRREIARDFGVTESSIGSIARGETWKHVS